MLIAFNEAKGTGINTPLLTKKGLIYDNFSRAQALNHHYASVSKTEMLAVHRKLQIERLQGETSLPDADIWSSIFTLSELTTAISKLTIRRAAGEDCVSYEMIQHFGPRALRAFLVFANRTH